MGDILALRQKVFPVENPEKRDPSFWSWEFCDGPEGKARLFVADDGGRIVGHYAVIPQNFVLGTESLRGSIVVDVMTHPDYRFQGMFKAIGKYALKNVSGDIEFATGYPIRKEVMPGHLSIGWIRRLGIPVLVRPLSFPALGRRFRVPGAALLKPLSAAARFVLSGKAIEDGLEVRPVTADDTGMLSDLARASAEPGLIQRDRTGAFFRWRYFESPSWKYEVIGAFRGATLVAVVIMRETELLDTPSLAFVDVLCRTGEEDALRALIDRSCRGGEEKGLAVAGAMMTRGTRPYRVLRRSGFFPGPHEFNLIVYATNADFWPRLKDDSCGWHLTWGDTDDV